MSDPIVFVQDILDHDTYAIPSSLKLLYRQSWELGQIILYQYQVHQELKNRSTQMIDMLGCQVFRHVPEGWQPCGGSGFGINYELSVSQIVQFSTGMGGSCEQVQYADLFGWAIAPEVNAVEAEFDSGQVIRSKCTNKVFALVAANASQVIHFRVYDGSDQILRQEAWPPLPT
jgi:hypothetical protein